MAHWSVCTDGRLVNAPSKFQHKEVPPPRQTFASALHFTFQHVSSMAARCNYVIILKSFQIPRNLFAVGGGGSWGNRTLTYMGSARVRKQSPALWAICSRAAHELIHFQIKFRLKMFPPLAWSWNCLCTFWVSACVWSPPSWWRCEWSATLQQRPNKRVLPDLHFLCLFRQINKWINKRGRQRKPDGFLLS